MDGVRWRIPVGRIRKEGNEPVEEFVEVKAASATEALALAREIRMIAPEFPPAFTPGFGGPGPELVQMLFGPRYKAIAEPFLLEG